MYELVIREEIDIFHKIIGEEHHVGVLHEHHLIIDVGVSLPPPEQDFYPSRQLMDIIEKEIQNYDSVNLNDLPEFAETRFLLEDLARILCSKIGPRLTAIGTTITRVEISDYRGKIRIIYRQD